MNLALQDQGAGSAGAAVRSSLRCGAVLADGPHAESAIESAT